MAVFGFLDGLIISGAIALVIALLSVAERSKAHPEVVARRRPPGVPPNGAER